MMNKKSFLQKISLIFILGLIVFQGKSQLFLTNSGESNIFSETPVENISAINKQVASIINITSGEIAVRIQNVAFHFPNKLMEEHFNENYMESSKFPISTFKGKIQETIDYSKVGTYDVSAKGILEMHGVKKEKILKGKLTVTKEQLTLISNFDVKLADYNIEIPTLVMAKIAESINIKSKFILAPKKLQ
ncbi:MAG: YceI family protein [Bacteroidota bacterium]|jgi:polyisoprenoid-binding protein YceI